MCRQLRRNIILGVDFGKKNCVGVQWTTECTQVLSIKGIPAIKVEETELGLLVTAAFHVKVPPQHNGVFALLTMAHQHSGHNGPPRTYSALKREYYWPGKRKDVFKHCKSLL